VLQEMTLILTSAGILAVINNNCQADAVTGQVAVMIIYMGRVVNKPNYTC